MNHIVAHPYEPSDAAQVTISTYDTNFTEPSLSMTKNSGSQLTKQKHDVSAATTIYHPQSASYPIEIHRQKSPTPDSPQ